jgi:hypothetical protein
MIIVTSFDENYKASMHKKYCFISAIIIALSFLNNLSMTDQNNLCHLPKAVNGRAL